MRLLCIDPGPVQSAWIVLDGDGTTHPPIVSFGLESNADVMARIREQRFCSPPYPQRCALEMVASYGMPVGREVFETVWWSGRFAQCFGADDVDQVYRMKVKMTLCHDSRAKDSNIRQAILDRYPATGGGKTPQVGVKAQKGPLFGISRDVWAALAVGLAWLETQGEQNVR